MPSLEKQGRLRPVESATEKTSGDSEKVSEDSEKGFWE